jgi:hypothetical protein
MPWFSGSPRLPVILEIMENKGFAGQSRDPINIAGRFLR